jgi:hypothetical protein
LNPIGRKSETQNQKHGIRFGGAKSRISEKLLPIPDVDLRGLVSSPIFIAMFRDNSG